jgi:spermidine synthase
LSFHISGAENYFPPHLKEVVFCLQQTLIRVFNHVYILPGDPVHFFACDGILPDFSAKYLISEIRNREISLAYIREYYLPFRFTADRIELLKADSSDLSNIKINSDLRPVAYYYHTLHWRSQFLDRSEPYTPLAVLLSIFFIISVIGFLIFIYRTSMVRPLIFQSGSASLSVLIMGFSIMSFQIFLMMSFQSIFGYLYYQLSILITMFMIGMGIGTFLGQSSKGNMFLTLAGTHAVIAMLPIFLVTVFSIGISSSVSAFTGHILFPAVAGLCGSVGGYQFSLATRLFHSVKTAKAHTGYMYGLDLTGGFAGALLLSGFLIPVYGFWFTAGIIAALNLFMCVVLFFFGVYSSEKTIRIR